MKRENVTQLTTAHAKPCFFINRPPRAQSFAL